MYEISIKSDTKKMKDYQISKILSGVFTHHESYLDQTYKKSLIDPFMFRCFSIYSDYTLFHLEVKSLR